MYSRESIIVPPEKILVTFGENERNVKLIERKFNVEIYYRGDVVTIVGEEKNLKRCIEFLEVLFASDGDVSLLLAQEEEVVVGGYSEFEQDKITIGKRKIKPRTKGQKELLQAIRNYDIVFAIGPAGTGKTFLSVAYGLYLLHRNYVSRLVLTRPAVEAGEKLGFLPGDMREKIDPYLMPLYDAIYDILGRERGKSLIEREIIEIAPLAFMRGRTLNNCFIILDEAQNTTKKQMKMFLTRFGPNSKAVITGDITQIDLEGESGLEHAVRVLSSVESIKVVRLTSKDIVRHPLVRRIVEAYGEESNGEREENV